MVYSNHAARRFWFQQRGWILAGRAVGWVLTAAGTAGAIIFATLAGSQQEEQGRWLALACLAALVPLVVSIVKEVLYNRAKQRLEEAVDSATARLTVAVVAYLQPCTVYLGQMAGEADAGRLGALKGQPTVAIVNAAAHLCGPEGQDVRAVYFEADKNTMRQAAYSGSSAPSPRVFTNHATDVAGKSAWDRARRGTATLWEDISIAAPKGFTLSATTKYETFITCGSLAGGRLYGMLNVDAPRSGDLGEGDVELVSLLARILAVGSELCRARS